MLLNMTRGGNRKPPSSETVRSWVLDAWRQVSLLNIENSIKCVGFSPNYEKWHITKHDVYG
jgi:hypothetical protein